MDEGELNENRKLMTIELDTNNMVILRRIAAQHHCYRTNMDKKDIAFVKPARL